jgi:hypothetical protein
MGGLALRAPVLATMFLIVALANLAMPGSSNFVGEFLILLGVFNAKIVICIVAFTGVALASVYTLRLFIRAMHNRDGPQVMSREMTSATGWCSSRSCLHPRPSRCTRSSRCTRASAAWWRACCRRRDRPARQPLDAAVEAARRRRARGDDAQGPAHRLGGAVPARGAAGGAIVV